MSIPSYTLTGCLPPFVGDPVGRDRSPYRAHMDEVAECFATSVRRCEILEGLLRYREVLDIAGISRGWQYLDGSFSEELPAGREPGDIDVITMCQVPASAAEQAAIVKDLDSVNALGGDATKATYHCDAYLITFPSSPKFFADQLLYFFGLFSHRRDTLEWKGVIEVELDRSRDSAARTIVAERMVKLVAS